MILKEPKRILGVFILTYTCFAVLLIINTATSSEKITGASSSGTVSLNILPACNVQLGDEYNVVSLCATPANDSVSEVIEGISDKVSFILRFDPVTQDFDVYSPDASTNDFENFEINETYVFFMKEAATLNIVGSEVNDINISLGTEFNAPSYPYVFSTNLSKYISPIEDKVLFVLKWNFSSQRFMIYSPEATDQEFLNINRGEGQYIFMKSPGVLRYNKTLLRT